MSILFCFVLKSNSSGLVIPGLGKYCCICRNSIKPACHLMNDVTQWLNCIVGRDVTLFIPHIHLLEMCYPQCNSATEWHHLSDDTQHPRKPQKAWCFFALYILYVLWLIDSSCCYESVSLCCVLFCIHALVRLFLLFPSLPHLSSSLSSPVPDPLDSVSVYLVFVLPALLICLFCHPSVLLISSALVSLQFLLVSPVWYVYYFGFWFSLVICSLLLLLLCFCPSDSFWFSCSLGFCNFSFVILKLAFVSPVPPPMCLHVGPPPPPPPPPTPTITPVNIIHEWRLIFKKRFTHWYMEFVRTPLTSNINMQSVTRCLPWIRSKIPIWGSLSCKSKHDAL